MAGLVIIIQRSLLKSDDPVAVRSKPGEHYPSNFDKPHSVNLISNYQFSHRYNISFNTVYSLQEDLLHCHWRYSTPVQQQLVSIIRQNKFRIPDYFRIDISVNIYGNHRGNRNA